MIFRRKFILYFLLLLQVMLLASCSSKRVPPKIDENTKEESSPEEELQAEEKNLYLVLDKDAKKKQIKFKNLATSRQENYNYTGGTYYLDKYDNHLTLAQIQRGEVVTLTLSGGTEKLSVLQLSDRVSVYDNISEYSFDNEKNSLKIGKSEYYFDNSLVFFSGEKEITLSEIGKSDVINIRSINKKLISVMVSLGHGIVIFENTQLYEEGYVTIESLLSEKLTKDMRLEVVEGTHLLTVKSDSREGAVQITVLRDEEIVVDLEALERQTEKKCTLTFRITPAEAKITLAGKKIAADTQQIVSYGSYKVKVSAEGYETWEKSINVKSAKASVSIDLVEIGAEETPSQAAEE